MCLEFFRLAHKEPSIRTIQSPRRNQQLINIQRKRKDSSKVCLESSDLGVVGPGSAKRERRQLEEMTAGKRATAAEAKINFEKQQAELQGCS